jgi:hypothetical protein
MEAILGYNWFDLVTLQLLACGEVTDDMICKSAHVPSGIVGYPVGFT